jgi:hypothetical protein
MLAGKMSHRGASETAFPSLPTAVQKFAGAAQEIDSREVLGSMLVAGDQD